MHPDKYKRFVATFTNGKRRNIRALHLTQAQHIARGIARANAWNVKTVTTN